jgi:hypothetical protein
MTADAKIWNLEEVVSNEQQLHRENTGETTSREGIIDGNFARKQEFCRLPTASVVSKRKWNVGRRRCTSLSHF